MTTIHRDIVNKLQEDMQKATTNYIGLSRTFEIPDQEILAGLMATITGLLLFIKSEQPAVIDLLVEILGKNDISTRRS